MQAESKAKKKTSFLSRFAEVASVCYQIKLSRLPLMGGNRDREGQLLRNRESYLPSFMICHTSSSVWAKGPLASSLRVDMAAAKWPASEGLAPRERM